MKSSLAFCTVLLALLPGLGHAADQSQIDEKHQSEWSYFERYGQGSLQSECGDIELVADEANWKRAIELQLNGQEDAPTVNSICQNASKILSKYCRGGRKEIVRSQFKKVICAFDENAAQSVEVKDNVLSITASAKKADPLEWAIGDALTDTSYEEGAWTFRQADLIQYQEKQHLAGQVDSVNGVCGTTIELDVEWATMIPQIDEALKDNATPGFYHFCKGPLTSLRKICGPHKPLVQPLKQVKCAIGPERQYTLADGVLSITAPADDEGLANFIEIRTGELIQDDEGFNHRELLFIDHEEKQMDYDRNAFKDKCGYEIDAKIDWKSFQPYLKPMIDSTTYALASECDAPVALLANACKEENKSKVIKSKVKSYVCAFHSKNKSVSTLKKKVFTFKTNLQEEDNSALRAFLIKKKLAKKPPKRTKMTPAEVRRALFRSAGDQCRSKCTSQCSGGKGASACRKRCKAACPK